MNIWDILIVLMIAGIEAFAFYRTRKRKAEGKSSCCGTCGSCSLCNASCAARRDQKS